MKRLLALLFAFALPLGAATITANLKTLVGAVPEAYLLLQVQNCGGYLPIDPGTGIAIDAGGIKLAPDGAGLVTATVPDSSSLICGTSSGTAYYRITVMYKPAGSNTFVRGPSNDYDIEGTFNLTTNPPPSPRNTATITPVIASADAFKSKRLCAGTPSDGEGYFYDAGQGCFALGAAAAGSGITDLNGENDTTQSFANADDTNVTLSIGSALGVHTFTMGWAGTLAVARGGTGSGTASGARTNLGLGTAAVLNVPATGDAASGEVVKGSDSRMTDARTPTAHASTHASAGSDPITVAESQVTNLTTDLAAKVPTSRTVCGHALSADVTCTASDVGAAATSHTHAASDIISGALAIARGGTNQTDPSFATLTLSASAVTWNVASALISNASVTLDGADTINVSNLVAGGSYTLKVIQDGTGSRTVTWGTGCTWKWRGGSHTLTTTASAIDIVAFTYDGTNCLAALGTDYK